MFKWYKTGILSLVQMSKPEKSRAANNYQKLLGFKSQTHQILQALDSLENNSITKRRATSL